MRSRTGTQPGHRRRALAARRAALASARRRLTASVALALATSWWIISFSLGSYRIVCGLPSALAGLGLGGLPAELGLVAQLTGAVVGDDLGDVRVHHDFLLLLRAGLPGPTCSRFALRRHPGH